MELLDRYLQAVKKHLPWERQDDILAELRANLESQLEDREAEVGRPLTTAEAEAWLKEIGPPMQMAGRYQPQQYLIGPAVFPMYWYVLRLACGWALVIYSIVSAVQILSEPTLGWGSVLAAILRMPWLLISTAAWITLVFAALEFMYSRYPQNFPIVTRHFGDWSPATLPPLDKRAAQGMKPSYAKAVAEVVFGFIFLAWLLLIPNHPYVIWGPGANYLQSSPFALTPVWVQFYWWVVGLNIVQLGWRCADLLSGAWQRPRPMQQIAIKLMGLVPLVVLLSVQDQLFLRLKHPALDESRYGETLIATNHGIHYALLIVSTIVTLQLVWEIGQMGINAYRKRIGATQ